MNDKSTGGRARGRGWLRGAATLIVTVSIALLVSGCGGGGTSAGSTASPSATSPAAKALAYAQCMRSHGVAKFPDPDSNGNGASGGGSVSDLGVSNTVLQAAMNACLKLQPGGGQAAVNSPKILAEALKYAQCLREHGEPNFPDPSSNGVFNITPSGALNPNSSAFQAAEQACQSVEPSSTNMHWENPS